MENLISESLKSMQDAGCSPFFLTSSLLSLLTGKKNRELSLKKAEDDIIFQKYLEIKKQEFEDEKDAAEWAYKKWLREKQREFEREESLKRLRNEYEIADLKLFFNDWPLHVEINTILDLYQNRRISNNNQCDQVPLNIILGKHSANNQTDILSENYTTISDKITVNLHRIGFDENTILRFNDKNRTTGGAALANVYALMNKLPSLMLMPNFLDDRLYFNIGLWGQDSILPLQKSVFSIECSLSKMQNDNSYLDEKTNEIMLSQITIAGVINDTYRMIEYNDPPKFPEFAKKNEIFNYPHLKEFTVREYESLQKPVSIEFEGKMILNNEVFSKREQNKITDQATNTIKYICQ